MTEPMKDAPRGVMNEPTQEFIEGSERRSITELIRENWTMRTEIASLRAGLHEKEGELQRAQQEHATLQQCIESWKKEELVWRQSDHEHRVKQQQMQAGAEQLCAELDLLRKRKDYHAEYMEVMAEVVQVRQERDGFETRCDTNTQIWIELGHKLGLNPATGPVDVDGMIRHILASESREKRVREALKLIAEGDDCGCIDHDSEDCCNNSGVHCAVCIAAEALKEDLGG